jgi:hypothetical protein
VGSSLSNSTLTASEGRTLIACGRSLIAMEREIRSKWIRHAKRSSRFLAHPLGPGARREGERGDGPQAKPGGTWLCAEVGPNDVSRFRSICPREPPCASPGGENFGLVPSTRPRSIGLSSTNAPGA